MLVINASGPVSIYQKKQPKEQRLEYKSSKNNIQYANDNPFIHDVP